VSNVLETLEESQVPYYFMTVNLEHHMNNILDPFTYELKKKKELHVFLAKQCTNMVKVKLPLCFFFN